MLRVWTLFILFNGALAFLNLNYTRTSREGSEAFAIVVNYDRKRVLEYVSRYQLVSEVSEKVFQKFEELRESDTDEETRHLNQELKLFADASPQDQKETIFDPNGNPSMFPIISAKIVHLNKIVRRELPNAKKNPDVAEFISNDAESYFEYIVYMNPVYEILAWKMADYEERGVTKEQIKEEIKVHDEYHIAHFDRDYEKIKAIIPRLNEKFRNKLGLIYEYVENTPENEVNLAEMKKIVNLRDKMGVKSVVYDEVELTDEQREAAKDPDTLDAYDIVKNMDFDRMFEYTTVIESAAYLVGYVFNYWPEVKLSDKESYRLMREVAFFIAAPIEIQEEAIFNHEFPEVFATIERIIAHLRQIAKREFPKLNKLERRSIPNEDAWVRMQVYNLPMHELITTKKKAYANDTEEEKAKKIRAEAADFLGVLFADKALRDRLMSDIETRFPARTEKKSETKVEFHLFNDNENEYEL